MSVLEILTSCITAKARNLNRMTEKGNDEEDPNS